MMKKSLGATLAIGLAGLQLLAVLLVVFSSYITTEQALIKHARNLLHDVSINTIEHSKGFLSPAQGAAELAAQLARNKVFASDDPDALEQLLFQQLRIATQFAGLYYGRDDGSFVMVMRSPGEAAPFRTKIIDNEDGERHIELIWRDDDFRVVKRQEDPTDTYDPRTRLWYTKAATERTTIWTDPYIFFSSQEPGITLAAPVMQGSDSIRGAIGVDIEISMISDFLSRLNIGQNGRAMIINHNGDVIAHPDASLIKTRNNDGTLRFADIREIDDPIARAAFGPQSLAGAIPVDQETPSEFEYDREPYVATIMPVISDRLPWTIAVYAPENDFTGVLKQNRTQNIWLAVLVAGLTGFLGLVLASYIHKPVRAFAVRTSLISQGELDPETPLPRTYRELERANDALVQQIVARRNTEHEYGQTFDMSSRGMAQIAPFSGKFIRVNTQLCEITGYSAAELQDMTVDDLLHPDEKRTGDRLPDDIGSDNPVNRELCWIRKDGEMVWGVINVILIRDEQGKPLHSVMTMDDVTQSKAFEEQILQLNRDLTHLARGHTMGQMAAGLAHELNQPLTAIAQNADTALLTLSELPQPDPELRDILTEIESQSLRAGEIIRALRAFIRKDGGASGPFVLGGLVEQTLRLIHPEASEGRVFIHTDIAQDLPRVCGNRVQVAQVIVNLLRNAIEALATDLTNDRRVLLSARRDGNHVRITVEDTGPGISPDVTLFSQFDTSKPEGMGLGLSISRSIVEANGGRLWNERLPHRGTRFIFTLPTTYEA